MGRAGYKRAYRPKTEKAEEKARKDVAKKYGKPFRNFDKFGINKRVELKRKYGVNTGEIDAYFNKQFIKHYKKIK